MHRFDNLRRANLKTVIPNKAHLSLATVAGEFDEFLLVTQNVDDLHERAGSLNVLHMHGSLLEKTCVQCHKVTRIKTDINVDSRCENCDEQTCLRPNIVWFGEMPFFMDKITVALMDCDLFISIGTSGSVYPAAGFVEIANQAGAKTVELNLAASDQQSKFKLTKYGVATEIVPEFFNNLV
ncbi:MAG: NAD-dependent protein deacylase [Proteobacteria bacterium]|nr:NAD-dependent protein deacylase [Pseudomonadota bacterium]